jgi:drug/metabolite transporter (DMT)-like permease
VILCEILVPFYFRRKFALIRVISLGLFFLGAVGAAFAGVAPTPEIDASSAVGAVALLGGAVLVLRARRRSR